MMNGVAGGRHLSRDSVLGESINPLDGYKLIYSYVQSDNIANYYLLDVLNYYYLRLSKIGFTREVL